MTGLGKTTLAHVVARHCGYRPVEINASDDRSAAALSQRVLDSAQMRTVTGDARPACIIIDEIDGAVGAHATCTAVLDASAAPALASAHRRTTPRRAVICEPPPLP